MVRVDNRSGVVEAVRHLVEHGHSRIAFAGAVDEADIRDRFDAYSEALRMHGIEPDPELHFVTANNLESGGAMAARQMLAGGRSSTAVVAATDLNAIGIMKVLGEHGVRCPDDQAIVGFDDLDVASSFRPALTTVRQDVRALGMQALGLLVEAIRGRPVADGRHLVPTAFVVRGSCGCTPQSTVRRLVDLESTAEMSATARLQAHLKQLLLGGAVPDERQAAGLERAASLLAAGVSACGGADGVRKGLSRDAAQALLTVNPYWTTAASAVACVEQFRRDVQGGGSEPALDANFEHLLRDLVMEYSEAMVEREARTHTALQVSIDTEHNITTSIVRGSMHDPSSLAWLSLTSATAGCLGLWSDQQQHVPADSSALTVTASFVRGASRLRLPAHVRVEDFPPRQLVERRRPGEIVAVIPMKTVAMDLGLLVVVTPTSGMGIGGRDQLFEKGVLLGMSMQREVVAEQLRRSNADLATFSHAMAHDLRNPLATISMWAAVARSRVGLGAGVEALFPVVERIEEAAAHSNDVIADLLRYADQDRAPTPAGPVDLGAALERAQLSLKSLILESGVCIEFRRPSDGDR